MGHIFGAADAAYLEKNPIAYLGDLAAGESFRMSEVQFYYEGPYDFVTVFTVVEPGKHSVKCLPVDSFCARELPGEINVGCPTRSDRCDWLSRY